MVKINNHARVLFNEVLDVPSQLVVFDFQRCLLFDNSFESCNLLLEFCSRLLEGCLHVFDRA